MKRVLLVIILLILASPKSQAQINLVTNPSFEDNGNFQNGDRDAFDADAGPDQMIEIGNTATLSAVPVGENAFYNWYNSNGNFVASGLSITVSPTASEVYRLEVIAEADRFMDVDEVEVVVNNFHIDNISPNPASNDISVDYTVDASLSTYLSIVPISNGNSAIDYPLDSSLSNINIDISGYASGIYTVVLIVNGYIVDAETLSIQ